MTTGARNSGLLQYRGYKAHRVAEAAEPELDGESVPDELLPQVKLIEQILQCAGIARLGMPGYETDDVIGSLASPNHRPRPGGDR